MTKPPPAQRSWAIRLRLRLSYEPGLRRWWKFRLSAEPSLWREQR